MDTAEEQLTNKAQIAAASDALITIFDKPGSVFPTCGISKSRFVAGMQCPKRLYLQVHRPNLGKLTNRRHLDEGTEIGVLARKLFPGGVLVDADANHEFDSTLAEKAREIIRELKSTSHRPVWITKHSVLTRAGHSPTYRKDALAATEAVLREHVESRDDYGIRRIRWAVAEMAARGETISGKTLLRKAGVHYPRLKVYKQLEAIS